MKKIISTPAIWSAVMTLSVLSSAQMLPDNSGWKPDYKKNITGVTAVQKAQQVKDYLAQELKKTDDNYNAAQLSQWGQKIQSADTTGISLQNSLFKNAGKAYWQTIAQSREAVAKALADKKAVEKESAEMDKLTDTVLSSYDAYQKADSDRAAAKKEIAAANKDGKEAWDHYYDDGVGSSGYPSAAKQGALLDAVRRLKKAESSLKDADKNIRLEEYNKAVAAFNAVLQNSETTVN